MVSGTLNMDPGQVRTALEQAGWSPARDMPVDRWLADIAADGWSQVDKGVEVLRRFGGLVLDFSRAGDQRYPYELDPTLACRSVDPGWARDYEAVIGERIMPIGLYGPMVLLVAESGAVYGGFDSSVSRLGTSFLNALEGLATGATGTPL